MRNIDNAILLAEYFNGNVTYEIGNFVERMKKSPQYLMLLNNITIIKASHSLLGKEIIDEFEKIDLNSIASMEEAYIVYGKINYLLKKSSPSQYINPFLYDEKLFGNVPIGSLQVDFDGKNRTLNEISLSPDYTIKYKIKTIREMFSKWQEEVNVRIETPLKVIAYKPRNINKRSLFSPIKIFDLILLIVMDLLWILAFYIPSFMPSIFKDKFLGLSTNTWPNYLRYTFLYLLIITVAFNCMFFISMNVRYKKMQRYLFAYNKVVNNGSKIIKAFRKEEIDLYSYMISQVSQLKTLDRPISDFVMNMDYLEYLRYLDNINHKKRKMKRKESADDYEFVFYSLIFVGVLIVAVIFLLRKVGVLK